METDVDAGCAPAGGGSAVLLAEFGMWLGRGAGPGAGVGALLFQAG